MLRPRTLAVLLLLLPVAPLAAAHEGPHETPPTAPEPSLDDEPAATSLHGYTGPGLVPYQNYFEGAWMYGKISASPIGDQYPRDMRGSGEWLVWEDAATADIFAYNIPAGSGFYLTKDEHVQRAPDIDGNVVVWEEYQRGRPASVYAYFLDTGETRLVSRAVGNNRNPSVHGGLIAWENDGNRTLDIWAYDVQNGTQFVVADGPDRQSDPLVLEGWIYFREHRFNIWDLFSVHAETGERRQITADVNIQAPPFTNGKDVLFLTQFFSAWALDRYDVDRGRVVRTPLKFQETTPVPASAERLLQSARDNEYRQLVARNITSGDSMHVSGNVLLTTEPWLDGRIAYLAIPTDHGTSLIALDISPFAWSAKPDITITSPRSGARWSQAGAVQGVLRLPGEWAKPTTFTYRIDNDPPVAIPVAERFRFVIDPAGREAGRHQLVVRATFREGPPVEANILLLVPSADEQGLDVEALGNEFHNRRVMFAMEQYLFANPASFALLALVPILLLLVLVRVWLALRPRRRRRVEIEYVPPE